MVYCKLFQIVATADVYPGVSQMTYESGVAPYDERVQRAAGQGSKIRIKITNKRKKAEAAALIRLENK